MSDEANKPALAPLARTLFGWALGQKRVGPIAIGLGAFGVLLTADELIRGRQGLNLPYESTPGFYAVLGLAVALGAIAIGRLFRVLFANLPAPDDEAP
jgi:hypothetical protein